MDPLTRSAELLQHHWHRTTEKVAAVPETRWRTVALTTTLVTMIATVIIMLHLDPYPSAITTVRHAAKGHLTDTNARKGASMLYAYLERWSKNRTTLNAQAVADTMVWCYWLAGAYPHPHGSPDGNASTLPRTAGALLHRGMPALYGHLILSGFQYSAIEDTVVDPDGTALVLTGSREVFYANDDALANDTVYQAQLLHLATLNHYQELAEFVLPLQVGHTGSHATEAHDVEQIMNDRWSAKSTWLNQNLPYTLVYLDGLEWRVHSYVEHDPEHHLVRLHEQIGITRLFAPWSPKRKRGEHEPWRCSP